VVQRRILIDNGLNRPIPSQGDAELLEAYVREIVRIGPSRSSPPAAALAREQILDLTVVTLGNRTGTTPKLGAASQFLSLKLHAAIERDPFGGRESIAAAAGISLRHANRMLALEGTSIERLLTKWRLSSAARRSKSNGTGGSETSLLH